MIYIRQEKNELVKLCSICNSNKNTKIIVLENNITKSGTLICLCKECREKLKKILDD